MFKTHLFMETNPQAYHRATIFWSGQALLIELVALENASALNEMPNIAHNNNCTVEQCGLLPHLLVCLEDVLCGDRANSCAQRLYHSICHFCAHTGGIGMQDTEVTLVTLHHQLQWAPLRVHAADYYCTLLTPPASTCRHTNPKVNLIWHVRESSRYVG